MLVGIKDAAKLVGISIIAFCAVFVCTLFLNFRIDIFDIKDEIISEQIMMFYEAQVMTAKVVSMVSGGCLLITSVIMLIFYIRHYIDTHKKELGILKALGYSNFQIAKNFWVFGTSVLAGAAIGFGGAFILMPDFYATQNKDKILPEIAVHFHPLLLLYLVAAPTIAFSIFAVFYAWYKLKQPVLMLLKETFQASAKIRKTDAARCRPSFGHARLNHAEHNDGIPFLDSLRKNTLKSRKTLVFFIIFASFCFSAMTQMSASMEDLSSAMIGAMILLIGLVLAFTTLFLAITTVIKGNTKTIAIMRVFGYSQKECRASILGCYRPFAYIGFALGTVYQYALLRIMVDIVFKDVAGVPVYEFDFPVMLVSLAVFATLYEAVMYVYSEKIKGVSVKEIMVE